jgi:hypothetical protein
VGRSGAAAFGSAGVEISYRKQATFAYLRRRGLFFDA